MNEQRRRENLRAFLMMIRACEGTAGPDGYKMLFGGGLFDAFDDHPRVRIPFTQTDGERNYSSAAGAYQILRKTWDRLQFKLTLPDFSPESQDVAARELIAECDALSDVMDGNLAEAMRKCAPIWASLPDARYPQPKRSVEFARAAYRAAGGALA
jgi:lysozyme